MAEWVTCAKAGEVQNNSGFMRADLRMCNLQGQWVDSWVCAACPCPQMAEALEAVTGLDALHINVSQTWKQRALAFAFAFDTAKAALSAWRGESRAEKADPCASCSQLTQFRDPHGCAEYDCKAGKSPEACEKEETDG